MILCNIMYNESIFYRREEAMSKKFKIISGIIIVVLITILTVNIFMIKKLVEQKNQVVETFETEIPKNNEVEEVKEELSEEETLYQKALECFSEKSYIGGVNRLKKIPNYKDASQLIAQYCFLQ